MAAGFDYAGASGKHYSFALMDVGALNAFPMHGGVIVFANYTPEPIWIGAVDNARTFVLTDPTWRKARELHEATLIYLHPVTEEDGRDEVVADLIEHYDPPMNE